jgi:acyl-CoA reductase-like NAD-dependent aldehyde dehydrogenase
VNPLETAGYEVCSQVETDKQGVFYLNQAMPFGGVKASGHGRFGTPQFSSTRYTLINQEAKKAYAHYAHLKV